MPRADISSLTVFESAQPVRWEMPAALGDADAASALPQEACEVLCLQNAGRPNVSAVLCVCWSVLSCLPQEQNTPRSHKAMKSRPLRRASPS